MKQASYSKRQWIFFGTVLVFCSQVFAASFSGKVFCPNNNPLPGADVCIYVADVDQQMGTISAKLMGKSVTDEKGEFKIVSDFPADSTGSMELFCVANKKDYSYTWAMSIGNQEEGTFELHLSYPQSISGKVVDPQQNPVAAAVIRTIVLTVPVTDSQNEMPKMLLNIEPMSYFTAISNAQGEFEIKDLPDSASMEFLVTKSGMGSLLTVPQDINPSSALQYAVGRKDVVLTLDKGLTVSGKVLDEQDKPIADATVAILPESFPFNLLTKPVKTDAQGAYQLTDLVKGKYRVMMQTASGQNGVETIDLQQDAVVSLKAQKGSAVVIKVVDESEKPVENAQVTLFQNGQAPIQGPTNAQGVFEKNVPAGSYSVQVYKQGMNRPRQSKISVEKEKTNEVTISLAGSAKITGLVTDAKGKPAAGVEIKILPNNNNVVVKTDDNGRYIISWTPEDMSWAEGHFLLVGVNRDTKEAIAVDIASDTTQMDLKLKPTLSVTGKVVDPEGKPIKQAELSVQIGTSNSYSPLDNKSIQTDSDGSYTLECLPVDVKYYINVKGPEGYGTGSVRPNDSAEMDGSVSNIKVEDTVLRIADKSISGKVMDVDGKAIEGAGVQCYGDGQPNLYVKSDKDGKFTLSPICDGVVRISAHYNKDNKWMYSNASIQAGDTEAELILSSQGDSIRAVKKPQSLIDKPLPKVLSDPNQFDGKALLICAWDYQQRPSRHFVKELSAKAGLFTDRAVMVVLLQAQPVDKAAITDWLKENNIGFTLDMIVADAAKMQFSLGVQGMPWLILTNKEHTVLAEGFDLQQLDTILVKIQ